MDMITITFVAFGLAMDAFAVSVSSGITIRHLKIDQALRIPLFFGSFQAIMPVIGWLAGLSLRDYISDIDHWIAFGLLSFIGCKMIYEALGMEADQKEVSPLNLYVLLMLCV
jgi:putative Mn2+ efflux pump MntP